MVSFLPFFSHISFRIAKSLLSLLCSLLQQIFLFYANFSLKIAYPLRFTAAHPMECDGGSNPLLCSSVSSHSPYVAIEPLKCGGVIEKTDFSISLNLNEFKVKLQ